MLGRKDFVETSSESDWNGNSEYAVVRVTDEGWHWLEANQDKLALKAEPAIEKPIPVVQDSDDIPF